MGYVPLRQWLPQRRRKGGKKASFASIYLFLKGLKHIILTFKNIFVGACVCFIILYDFSLYLNYLMIFTETKMKGGTVQLQNQDLKWVWVDGSGAFP